MARLCERPGCSQPAEVIYSMSVEQLTVWIEPFDGSTTSRAGVLCRRHADAMVVPLGWMLDDRREPVPRLFKPKEAAAPSLPRPRRQRSRTSGDDTGQLELAVDEMVDDADDGDVQSDAFIIAAEHDAPTEPWKPTFDQQDDLDGLLTAESPLLSRAFGLRGRPKK